MIRVLLLVCLTVVAGQGLLGDLLSIAGHPANDLLTVENGNHIPLTGLRQTPNSHRTLFFFKDTYLNDIRTAAGGLVGNYTSLFIIYKTAPLVNPVLTLQAPYLEVNNDAPNENSRCNPVFPLTKKYAGVPLPVNFVDPARTILEVTIPNNLWYEHLPSPNDSPFESTYRKLCFARTAGVDAVDTTLWVAVTRACMVGVPTTNIFSCALPANPFLISSELTDGEKPEYKLDRLRRTTCCGYAPQQGPAPAIVPPAVVAAPHPYPLKYGICINREAKGSARVISECCGDKPYTPQSEKCCSKNKDLNAPVVARIQFVERPCPCQSNNIEEDCNAQGPNVLTAVESRNRLTARTNSNDCCIRRKYKGSLDLAGNATALKVLQTGLCYSRSDTQMLCCDDGNLYDPGTNQCCPLSGIQKVNIPCPCGANSDCPSTATTCCTQQFPLPRKMNHGGATQCNKFANWNDFFMDKTNTILGQATDFTVANPTNFAYATANARIFGDVEGSDSRNQKCFGKCYNAAFQTCCNGVTCIREYERCCNATCCNRFTSTCTQGLRPGPGVKGNSLDYSVSFETCSEKENLTVQRAWLVFVLPTLLLFATLASLAIVIVVARRATEEIFELTERVIVLLASFVVLFATPFFFAPVYKYGVVLAFTGLFLIVSAVIRSRNISLTAIFVLVALVIFLVEPFNGNIYLSLTGGQIVDSTVLRPSSFRDTQQYFGVLNAVIRLSPLRRVAIENNAGSNGGDICTNFYNFFGVDEATRDTARDWNPVRRTFGYCSRAWITAVLIFAAVEILLTLVLLMLAIFSFVKRMERKEDVHSPLQMDVKVLG